MSIEQSPRETKPTLSTDELQRIPTLPEAPDNAQPLTGERRETKKSKKGLIIGLGAGAAGIAIAAGAVFGVSAMNQAPESKPVPTATADTPEAGGETQGPAGELTVEQLEIPAGLDAETLGKMLVGDRFSEWSNAGADDGLFDRFKQDKEHQTWETFLPVVAEENRQLFADALYIPGSQQDPKLAQYIDGATTGNFGILDAYRTTQWSDLPQNIEGYRQWDEVQSVTELPDDDPNDSQRTIAVDFIAKDNSDKNVIKSTLWGGVNTYTITLKDVDGKEKISAISVK